MAEEKEDNEKEEKVGEELLRGGAEGERDGVGAEVKQKEYGFTAGKKANMEIEEELYRGMERSMGKIRIAEEGMMQWRDGVSEQGGRSQLISPIYSSNNTSFAAEEMRW